MGSYINKGISFFNCNSVRDNQNFIAEWDNMYSRATATYEGVLISPYPDLLPDVVGWNR